MPCLLGQVLLKEAGLLDKSVFSEDSRGFAQRQLNTVLSSGPSFSQLLNVTVQIIFPFFPINSISSCDPHNIVNAAAFYYL